MARYDILKHSRDLAIVWVTDYLDRTKGQFANHKLAFSP